MGSSGEGYPDATDGSESTLPPLLVARARRNRADLLQGLKAADDLAKQISTWAKGDLYRASGRPEVILNLKPNSDGSVMGWAQGSDGKFIGQARWTTATTWGSRVVSSASVLAGHAMLVEINHKLDQIEAKVDRVKQSLDDDRRQRLQASIDSVSTALACELETARDLLISSANDLRTAILQEIQALSRQIEQTPMPSRRHTVRAVWDISLETRQQLLVAESSLLAVLHGLRALMQLYLGLGEDRAAWATAHELLVQLSEVGLKAAWWKARHLLPNDLYDAPEVFWTRAIASLTDARDRTMAFSQGDLPELSLSLVGTDLSMDRIG
jgi:hypothetical protein